MVSVREASVEDAAELLEIYRPYVEHTDVSFEYVTPSVQEFASRIAHTLQRYPYLVAQNEDGELLGYAYASAFKSREAYDWSVELSVYVKDGVQRQGVGRLLYTELEKIIYAQNVYNLCACIAYPYPDSEKFHERMGFQTVAHFHHSGFKSGHWVDMIWMEKALREHDGAPEPFIPYSHLD